MSLKSKITKRKKHFWGRIFSWGLTLGFCLTRIMWGILRCGLMRPHLELRFGINCHIYLWNTWAFLRLFDFYLNLCFNTNKWGFSIKKDPTPRETHCFPGSYYILRKESIMFLFITNASECFNNFRDNTTDFVCYQKDRAVGAIKSIYDSTEKRAFLLKILSN